MTQNQSNSKPKPKFESADGFAPTIVALIGPPGAGKTSTGKLVAERLGWSFMDTDQLIEAKAGRSVSEIFEKDGEPAFRKMESEVVNEMSTLVLGRKGVVLATGGGLPVNQANLENLMSLGLVIFLNATPLCLKNRLVDDNSRPLLAGSDDLLQRLSNLMASRKQYYTKAPVRIDTEDLTVEEVAYRIQEMIEEPKSQKRL